MRHRLAVVLIFCTLVFGTTLSLFSQSPTATVNGQVRDTSGAVLQDADVQLINEYTNVKYPAKTNSEGIYSVISLPPGTYRIQVSKAGFKSIIKPDVILNVLDARAINFDLPVGAVSETITVEGGTPLVNTESATVSTVVDRQFAENLPMNGRSFQTLIDLTPGVVLTASTAQEAGQFSANGQRSSANYFTVDGVSANFGVGTTIYQGNGAGGAVPSFSVQGGTNSLVSVDALQEFRIQTSTFAPEFGRTPGAQISIVTRSGTNQFHGTAFNYLRNDVLDANDWFANARGLPKPEERQNDFGGTLSGYIAKGRTFFFFSYEGLRLRLPQVVLGKVPSLSARQNSIPDVRPFLNAYPVPAPSAPDKNGVSPFNASYSDKSTLDAVSLRIDHKLNDKFSVLGRYNYSPSELVQRLPGLSTLQLSKITVHTATVGANWILSSTTLNDVRFNYSRSNAHGSFSLDDFGGAIPLSPADLQLPSPLTAQNSQFTFFSLLDLSGPLQQGAQAHNLQQQFNFVENLSAQKGKHSLKFGVDYRRLTPLYEPLPYTSQIRFLNVPAAEMGNLFLSVLTTSNEVTLVLKNLGVFAQDSLHVNPRLTLTYGVRWDVDFAPNSSAGPSLAAVTGVDDLSTLGLARPGTPPFQTQFGNFAPRLGVAYQLSQRAGWDTVVRGGAGIFVDLITGSVGNNVLFNSYPIGASALMFGGRYPSSFSSATPPTISPSFLASPASTLFAFDPKLKLPFVPQWNLSVEQSLGPNQSVSASYIGALGRRLLQSEYIPRVNANISAATILHNAGTSDYHSLQIQFQRRMSHGLQALTSYTWAHSVDTGSASSPYNSGNIFVRELGANSNRGPSDFDIRHALSAGLAYDVPAPKISGFIDSILGRWSLQSILQVRSAPPVGAGTFYNLANSFVTVRPDVVPGQTLYVYGSQCVAVFGFPCPGGKGFNPAAFTPPPLAPVTFAALRQGDLGRNALRGFGAWQWDLAIHRDFPIREPLKLQFRVEFFNVLNHPNFGGPFPTVQDPRFGQAQQMLGRSLSSNNQGAGGLSPLYQIGGPRSTQIAVRVQF